MDDDKALIEDLLAEAPLGGYLGDAARRVYEQEAAALDNRGQLQPVLTLMWHIYHEPGQPISHYAARMSLDLASIGRYVNSLVADGLIEKVTAENDQRKRMLRLLPAGVDVLIEQRRAYVDYERDVRARLGNREYEKLVASLKIFLQRNVTPR
ncbi:MarR family winged helix-turn-helix transcriptional regulator [Sulfitobacter sp. LCG007]